MSEPCRLPTRKLFKQFNPEGVEDLQDWRERIVAVCDPTEYMAAIELVGSWAEWQRFKREWPHFRENILPEWLAEVEVKMRSEAVRNVIMKSTSDAGAAKWLAEGRYSPARKGRPSKAEVEKQAKIQARIDDEVNDDLERVRQSASISELKIAN